MTVHLPLAPPEGESRTETHCPYCALQCGMTLLRRGARVEVASRDFVTNKGGLCRKGWTAAELLVSPERLTTPLMRRGQELVPASWSEAIDFVVSSIRALQLGYGRDAVGIFGGGGLTNEKAYMLGKVQPVSSVARGERPRERGWWSARLRALGCNHELHLLPRRGRHSSIGRR